MLGCVGKPRVMVVDDEPGMLHAVRRVLERDAELRLFESPTLALAELSSFAPELVLLDIRLPELDGFATLQRIKRQAPGTDVVFVGQAHTPGHRRQTEIMAQLEVGPLRKSIAVIGEREWVGSLLGSVMSSPVPFTTMPIVYERAFGGRPPSQWDRTAPKLDERNPVGTGYCATRRDVAGMRLPNLEDPGQRIRTWRQQPPIAGLGAIDAH